MCQLTFTYIGTLNVDATNHAVNKEPACEKNARSCMSNLSFGMKKLPKYEVGMKVVTMKSFGARDLMKNIGGFYVDLLHVTRAQLGGEVNETCQKTIALVRRSMILEIC